VTPQEAPREIPLVGWWAIATAVTRAVGASVSVRTAQRYAEQGRRNRLPVDRYDNGVVYLMPSGLRLWVNARSMPLGGRPPGLEVSGRRGRRRLA
jgi:hypothetical protein